MLNVPQFPTASGLHVPGHDLNLKKSTGLALPSVLHAPVAGGNVPSLTSITLSENDARSQEEIQEIQNEINLRILQAKALDEQSHLPFWMRNYKFLSYLCYLMISLFSLFYLICIGIFQADPKMQIHYVDIVRYLEYNSYSILSPLMCPVLMGVLAYHVYNRVNLDEGDFFGILGALLLLALVSIHDAYGVYKLSIQVLDRDVETREWDPPPQDINSRNELHWQYAWSTSRYCMKRYVKGLIYQHQYDGLHIHREILVQSKSEGRHLPDYFLGPDCDLFNAKPEKAKLKDWMKDLQHEYSCCGPYGEAEWEPRFTDWKTAGCHEEYKEHGTGILPGCYEPLMRWLQEKCVITYWIMFVQAMLYIVSGVFAVVHHTAMKLAARVIVKQYSLLDMTDRTPKEDPWWRQTRPADKPMIVGDYSGKKADSDGLKGDGFGGKSLGTESKTIMMRGGNKARFNKKKSSAGGKKLVAINSTVLMHHSESHGHVSSHSHKPE